LPVIRLQCFPKNLPSSFAFYLSCGGSDTILDKNCSERQESFLSVDEIDNETFRLFPAGPSDHINDSTISIEHVESMSCDRARYTDIGFEIAVASENPNPLPGAPPESLTDNRPALLTISVTPDDADISSFSLNPIAEPSEEINIINKMGTELSFMATADPLVWRSSPVYWYGIAPEKECYTYGYQYQFFLEANLLTVATTDRIVSMPNDDPVVENKTMPPNADTMCVYGGIREIEDANGRRTTRFLYKLVFTNFLRKAELSGFPVTHQYADETMVEELFHVDQVLANVSIDEGGLGDCYSAAGLRYHAELYFRDAYGESLSASDFVVDDDSREGAKAFALEIATAAINLEIQVGGAVEAAKRKFSEFKAKQVAGHNAAYRYHCTYQEGTNATPENCIHPAFQ
nr:hypothetical protein [Schwartzia sp. (in: firmicutes)]